MTPTTRRCGPAVAIVLSSLGWVRAASAAEGHRVAAVDPDAELARALDIALSPWGATVTHVRVDHPGATIALPTDQAREIALATHADVVMWVSNDQGRTSAWIYDVASDHASLRELTSAPPFDPTTAAAVALSVKALLRFTVVAPPRERFGAAVEEPTWVFGLATSYATHFGLAPQSEPRVGAYVSYWPESLHHRWGVVLGLSTGFGVQVPVTPVPAVPEGSVNGILFDYSARVAVGARLPFRSAPTVAVEPSLGVIGHFITFQYSVSGSGGTINPPATNHFAYGADTQLAVTVALFQGFVQLAPWIGASLTTPPHDFVLEGTTVVEAAAFSVEGGLRAEFALP